MQANTHLKTPIKLSSILNSKHDDSSVIHQQIAEAWKKIAPFWPLKNLIATNPLQGLENLPFEQALIHGERYFQQSMLPTPMEEINRETIKWCQAFFDEGQATISMPYRDQGLYGAWQRLARFDKRLHRSNTTHRIWLENLSLSAEQTIADCLTKLAIPQEKYLAFLTMLLTTLPGWASYIKYKTEWMHSNEIYSYPVTQADYLAMRLVITCLLWPEAIDLLHIYQDNHTITSSKQMEKIVNAEKNYQKNLIHALSPQPLKKNTTQVLPKAQLIFCIDVRSEPFRRALEIQDNYETFGFAGFFGVPVQINNELTEESYASCPVLLQPKHVIKEKISCSTGISNKIIHRKKQISNIKRFYQTLKYTFTTPFILAELLGPWSGLWMSLRTMTPNIATSLKETIRQWFYVMPPIQPLLDNQDDTTGIDLDKQCIYAESILRTIGLTQHFSSLVILCGHASETQNNAYASSLDCGACGGHSGAANARILATILNNIEVRKYLEKKNIFIPVKTKFIAALHNTTTDEVKIDEKIESICETERFMKLKYDLGEARKINSQWRCQQMGYINTNSNESIVQTKKRSRDWAQTRPEWGLARNAAFIIGPRYLTKKIDLEGRAFLHSFDWQQDKDGIALTTILTAPLIVAQWINSQYLFSALDNIAYGSGSKITHNITGKIGIMQGNASDLMHGLSLQSIYKNEEKAYHEPVRLMTIVYAPRVMLNQIIAKQPILQKLFGNGWISMICIESEEEKIYYLQRDLTWHQYSDKNINHAEYH